MSNGDGSKFYRTKEFRRLNSEWRERLAKEGFVDQENEKEELKTHDRRTVRFDDREELRDYFMRLDHFLTNVHAFNRTHQRVLKDYSEGKPGEEIAKAAQISKRSMWKIIAWYKRLLTRL